MLITWTWQIATLALGVPALLVLIVWLRRRARPPAPQRAPAPPQAASSTLPGVGAGAEVDLGALHQRARQRARERAERARQARAASEAAQAEAAAVAAALAQARVDLELDLPAGDAPPAPELAPAEAPGAVVAAVVSAEATAGPAADAAAAPEPEHCLRTAELAEQVQAARQARPAAATPVAAAAQAQAQAPAAVQPVPTRPPGWVPLVLVVDDAKTVRVKIGRVLQSQGLRLAYAVDGEDALQQLAEQQPDLVITDMDMPRLDGLGLTRALRSRPATASLPVIMVSAADDRHRAEAASAGVTAVLGKPFGDERLIDLVQSVLALPAAGATSDQQGQAEPA